MQKINFTLQQQISPLINNIIRLQFKQKKIKLSKKQYFSQLPIERLDENLRNQLLLLNFTW